MSNFFNRNKNVLLLLARNLFLASVFIVLLEKFSNIGIGDFFNLDILYFLVFFFGFSWLFFYLEEQGEKLKNIYEPYFKYGFVFLLLLISFCSLNFGIIEEMESLKTLQEFLNHYSYFIFLLTTGVFFFTLYLNKETVFLKKDTEENKNISKSPRMKTAIILILIMSVAFILRFWNLNILDPYTDEYNHMFASIEILENGVTEYTRALLVTYSVTFFYWLGNADSFYEYLFWGRLPGVIFSSLTIIPIYLLGRELNKYIGLIAAALWAISPWAIGVAKTIREYAYYPFFVLITIYALLHLIDLLFNKPRKHLLRITILIIYIVSFITYAIYIETLCTLRISFPIIVFVAIYYTITHLRSQTNIIPFLKQYSLKIAPIILLILFSVITYALSSEHVTFNFSNYEIRWWEYILEPNRSPMHWWFKTPMHYLPHTILGIGMIYSLIKKDLKYFMYFAIFAILMFFFIFLFDRYTRPRYIFYILPFFSILISTSIYILYKTLKNISLHKNILKKTVILTFSLFILITFNYQNTLFPATSDKHGYVNSTNEHHDNVQATVEYLQKNATKEDAFIATLRSPLAITLDIERKDIHDYRYQDEDRFEKVEKFIEKNPQGFMVLDWRRNGHWAEGYPREGEFYIGNTHVKVVQNTDGIQIYRWGR